MLLVFHAERKILRLVTACLDCESGRLDVVEFNKGEDIDARGWDTVSGGPSSGNFLLTIHHRRFPNDLHMYDTTVHLEQICEMIIGYLRWQAANENRSGFSVPSERWWRSHVPGASVLLQRCSMCSARVLEAFNLLQTV